MTHRVIFRAMVRSKGPEPGRLIKRYENRKLYDSGARRYVTLEDLSGMVAQGLEVRVVDQRTGDDLTALVLAQVILEGIKQRTAKVPRQLLERIIRLGASADGIEWISPVDAASRVRSEVEKAVSGLLGRGRLSLDEALELRQELASLVQRTVADAHRSLESRVQRLLAATESPVHPSLSTLKERLEDLETTLAPATKAGKKSPSRPGRKNRR